MAGGAERGRPRGPGLAAAFRAAAYDFYYQSIRLVPANLLWGLAFLAWLIVSVSTGPLVTLVAAPLLAVPWVGVVRLAALTARGQDVVLSDIWTAIRRYRARRAGDRGGRRARGRDPRLERVPRDRISAGRSAGRSRRCR